MYSSFLEENLKFLLRHFEEPLFPRTISTFATCGRQIDVRSVEEMVSMYEQADYLDCRVNAYNSVGALHAPNLLFIDIDRSDFKSDRAHKIVLRKTLDRIKYYLDGHPTVTWSGNGYQIIQPLDAYALEQDPRFANLDNHATAAAVSVSFLRFAERFLSGGKSDQNHNPSFKSCLVRVPYSYNSKCVFSGKEAEVKILQRWNNHKPKIRLLLGTFRAWLAQQTKKQQQRYGRSRLQISAPKKQNPKVCNQHSSQDDKVLWIERLLQIPIGDFRKTAVNLILAPYLVNIRRMPVDAANDLIVEWLERCDGIRRLDFDPDKATKYALGYARQKGYLPLKKENLKARSAKLYNGLFVVGARGFVLSDYSEDEDFTTTIIAAPIGYNATNPGATMKNDAELTAGTSF